MISGHRKNNRWRESMNIVGFVSGNPGVSASVNGSRHLWVDLFQRAACIRTSSAVLSPEPWNQHTSRSPLGSSTIEDEWLCHFSRGKINSPLYSGAAAAPEIASRNSMAVRIVMSILPGPVGELLQNQLRGVPASAFLRQTFCLAYPLVAQPHFHPEGLGVLGTAPLNPAVAWLGQLESLRHLL